MSSYRLPYPGSLLRVSPLLLDLSILLLLWVPGASPLLADGFILGHDFEDPPWRSLAIARSLSEGILYPRWSAELFAGFGAPIFNFYAPLSYYPAAILSLVAPIGLLDASKVTFALALLASGVGAYLLAHEVLRHRGAALLAGILYMYSTGVIGDLYVRTSLGGSVSLALIPFAMYSLARLLDRPGPVLSAVTGLLLGALLLSHNINSAIGLGMMALFAAFHYLSRRDLKSLPPALLALSLGVGLATFFLLPSLMEMGMTRGARYDMLGHFVNPLGGDQGMYGPEQFDQTDWGPFDLHPAYPYGLPPYKFGLIQGLLLAATGVALLFARKRPWAVVSLFVATLVLFYLHTTWSLWLYERVPASNVIAFPWRFIRPAGLALAVAASWAVIQTPHRWHQWLIPALAMASLYSAMALAPSRMEPFPFGPITPEGLVRWQEKAPYRLGTQLQGQFLPLSVQWERQSNEGMLRRYAESFPPLDWAADTAYFPRTARARVLATRKTQNWMQAEVEARETTPLAFHTIYFAGWTAYLDGRQVPIEPSGWTEYEHERYAALGVVQVEVPEGRHLATLVYEDTPVRTLADWVSRFSLMAALALLLASRGRGGDTRGRRRFLVALGLACVVVVSATYLLGQVTASVRARDWVRHTTRFDLSAEIEGNRLGLVVPEGRMVVEFIHTKTFDLQGDRRPVVYMHPPASAASGEMWIPSGARFEYTVGMDPEVWGKSSDGVVFRVGVREGDRLTPVLARHVDPLSEPRDRSWVSGVVDLGPFAGRVVELVLSTDSGKSGDYDWAGWATARIVVD